MCSRTPIPSFAGKVILLETEKRTKIHNFCETLSSGWYKRKLQIKKSPRTCKHPGAYPSFKQLFNSLFQFIERLVQIVFRCLLDHFLSVA